MSDLISRQAVENITWEEPSYSDPLNVLTEVREKVRALPSVENKGTWIYDKSIYNWRCSECGKTPPPTGYVGKAEFMATHFKFCNYCGADMRGKADEQT